MFEIEMKAHVQNKDALREKLNKFFEFQKKVIRNDTYFSKPIKNNQNKNHISIRIREETLETQEKNEKKILLTYKRKELTTKNNGELNEEMEAIISNREAIETFLFDAGFSISLKKTKIVEDFLFTAKNQNATLELCTIETLGDFLEIEILSENNDKLTVQHSQETIKELFKKLEIPESAIEPRYYSEMLKEKEKN